MCREGSADKFSAALAFQMYMGVFMRKKYKIAVGLLGAVVFLLAILGGSLYVLKANVINHKPAMERGRDAQHDGRQLTVDEQVEEILSDMSITERIGQMVMVGVPGKAFDNDSRYVLGQFHYGGIILFDRNLESKDQTKKLIADLQSGANEKLPLFIAIDEEGGAVVRGESFIPAPPAAEDVGKESPEFAEGLAVSLAEELISLGINVNFAPVADVGASEGRSYSTDPYEVLAFIKSIGNGYHSAGIIYALKHFPGIGRGTVDSHKEISSIEASEEELQKADIMPFREMIHNTGKGKDLDYMVMVGHLKYPAFDAENAASLSRTIITDLLRNDLGYQGIVITDDLEMGAVANHLTFREAGLKAVQAGADIVLVCHELAHAEDAYMGIYNALQNGQISEERINESVRRIIKAKLTHGLTP